MDCQPSTLNAQLLLQHFDLLADQPDAVAKMRELVWQLAVRGKLLAQNPKDESADILLEKIAAAKAAFVKANKLKAPAPEVPIRESDIAFTLPRGWAWAKLADLSLKLGAGSTPLGGKNVYQSEGIKFLRSQNVWNDGLQLDDVAFIPQTIHAGMSATHVEAGDVLLNITGASIGRCAVVPDDFDEANVSQHVAIVRLVDKSLRHFIHLCVISPDFQQRIMEVQVGVSREGLSMTRLKEFVVAVPPLAEQRRIVAKVDDLMALCDELGTRHQARHAARAQLQQSALHHLLAAREPQTFAPAWQRVRDQFHLLHDTPDAIPQFRQAILQLAVQGRLVPQNPKDEPAEILLRKISSTKQAIAKSNGQQPPKIWPKVPPNELDQEFPKNWAIARLGDVAINIEAGNSPLCEGRRRTDGEWGVLKISAVSWDKFDPEENKALPANIKPRPEFEVRDGDFVMSRANTAELVAKSVIAHKPPPKLLLNDKTLRVHFTDHTDKKFINLVNNSLSARAYYARASAGTSSSMKNITREAIAMLPIGVPPLAEQKRIVERVEALLRQCDALEAQLRQTRTLGAHFLDATLHHLLAA